MSLICLPYPLLRQIAGNLDIHSASNFATTVRTFQEPAETRIWRKIKFNSGDLAGTIWRRQLEKGPATSTNRLSEHQRSLDVILKLVTTTPSRAAAVRDLEFYLPSDIPTELVELLDRVSRGLEELFIQLPPSLLTMIPRAGSLSVHLIFDELRSTFALRVCRLKVHYDWEKMVTSLLQKAPNLRELHVRNHCSEPIPSSRPLSTEILSSIPNLSILTTFIFEDSLQKHSPLLAAVVERAPNLQKVVLRDHAFQYRPPFDDALLIALSRLQHLDSLEIIGACLDVSNDLAGFHAVEETSVLWVVGMMADRRVSHSSCCVSIPMLMSLISIR